MILDRIGEGGLEGVQGEMRSRLVGFEGMVVEEDMTSGGMTSVLIYGLEMRQMAREGSESWLLKVRDA